MEYCSGGELQDSDISSLSILQKLTLFEKICEGVAHLHTNGVIHRDLKPNNIFFREDKTPVVGDLGLCLLTEQDERLTETAEAIGARLFMAPELEDGRFEEASYVADIYSLGKILYWLVANRKIFSREKHRNQTYDLTTKDRTAAITFVYHLFDGSIKAEPSERVYSDAGQLLTAVQNTIARITTMAHAVDRNIEQECTYCGAGKYQIIAEGSPGEQGFAYKASYPLGITLNNIASYNDHRWLVMACDYCGNLQWFRLDLARENPRAWQSGSLT
jgi:serine/threonine protein kinase